MQANPFTIHINNYFTRLLELRHTVYNVSTALTKSAKEFKVTNDDDLQTLSNLVISDWTGPTDNGWTIHYLTGASKVTYKKDYKNEIERIISLECAYSFAQSFEALETFLKDCVFTKANIEADYLLKLKSQMSKDFDRNTIPGGDKLFDLVKLACNENFKKYSTKNNRKIKFKEFWSTFSEVRHSITHSSSKIKISKLSKSGYHFAVFKYFFNYSSIDNEIIQIELDYKKFDDAIKAIAEFGFQIFKILSINDNLNWGILKA